MSQQQFKGLTDSQVQQSRAEHGANVLTPKERRAAWRLFLDKFREPLIIILLVAGVASIGISIYEYNLDGEFKVFFEPIGIFAAIFLATGLGFIFERKADKEFNLLNKVSDDEAVQVWRNGVIAEVPKKDIVVGDIVVLNTGGEIPADGELLEAVSLNVDESTLTGEPSAHKTVNPDDFDPEATFPSNQVMRGTKVMEGHGVMRVFAVGDHTENGKVFEAAQIDDSVKTPLSEQLDGLGKVISRVSYVIGILIVAGRLIMYFTDPTVAHDFGHLMAYLLQTVMIAVTLVVVSVPEGLPMAVTLSLALSMRRMLKTNNLVRKLHACETMGATTVICTDKTGTLTQNQMQVYKTDFFGLDGQKLGADPLSRVIAEGIAVNSTAQLETVSGEKPKVLGNPTEGALLLWLASQGLDYTKLKSAVDVVEELPFSTENKFMATVISDSTGAETLYVKGAPEIVMSLCRTMPDGVSRADVDALLLGYQNQAMRTLGFAVARLAPGARPDLANLRETAKGLDLRFLGAVAIADPVRPDVPAAINEVLDAGVKVKIVTGDTPATAREIGRQVGL